MKTEKEMEEDRLKKTKRNDDREIKKYLEKERHIEILIERERGKRDKEKEREMMKRVKERQI